MTQDEALKLALEALETELSIDWTNNDEFNASSEKMYEAITAIKEALAQPAVWVGLTDYEIGVCSTEAAMNRSGMVGGAVTFARAIESKLKQKNGFTEEKNT